MAKYIKMNATNKKALSVISAVLIALSALGQKADTLHLYYHFSQINGLPDTTNKKIEAFIAKLNNVPTDATVVSYYHKGEFKKISTDRAEDVLSALRGKARVLFTLGEVKVEKVSDPEKMKVVDIIYKPTGSAVVVEDKKKVKENPDKKKEDDADKKKKEADELKEKAEKMKKEAEKLAKEAESLEKDSKKSEEQAKKDKEDAEKKKKEEEDKKKKEELNKNKKELSKEEQELEKAKKELEEKIKDLEKKKKETEKEENKGKKEDSKDVDKEKKEADKKAKETKEAEDKKKKEDAKPKKADEKKKDDKKEVADTKPKAEVNAKPKVAVPFFHLDEFKKRKLIVVLLEESPEETAKLSKNAAQLEQYKQNVKKYNDNLTKVITDQWKETPFEFTTESKAKALNFDENYDKVVFMLPGKKEMEQVPFLVYNISMAYVDGKSGKPETKLYENKFKVALQSDVPSIGELSCLIEKLKTFYTLDTEFDRGELVNVLKDKRLLLDKEFTSASEEEIRAVYPYSFKLATAEEIAQLADKRAKNNLYVKVEVFNHAINYVMIDTETDKVMSRVVMNVVAPKAGGSNPFASFNCGSRITPSETDFGYTKCNGCAIPSGDVFKLYTQKAKLTANDIKILSTEEEQEKITPLIPY